MIYIFSDGFQDQVGGANAKKFSSKQLKQLLIQNHKLEPENQKQILEKNLYDWQGKYKQVDDITIMGVKI